MNATSYKHNRSFAILAAILTLVVLFVPLSSDCGSEAASGDIYRYVIHPDGTIEGDYDPIGTSSTTGSYTSVNGTNSGSWAFDEYGYGPFNSFYAAFDPVQNNRMIGHLDPDDLTRLVDGTSIAGKDYNIMWCLPTVYWLTDSNGNLILTDDPDAGGTAYAHTIEGHTYNYIGIGVYEASKQTVGGQTILTSFTDSTPTVNQSRSTFREQSNNQLVNTDGNGNNGYAMLWNFYQWELYKYCALAVMGSWNSQEVAGNGNVYGGDHTHTTGDHDKSGPYAGTKGSSTRYYKDPVKVFIESAWGGTYDFVDGVVVSAKEYYIDQSAVPTDKTSGTYITNPSGTLPGSSGYGSSPSTEAMIWGMPTATRGSSTIDLCDYIYSDRGSNYTVYIGGGSNLTSSNAPFCGLSYADCFTNLSDTSFYIGGRLAFVFDSDPMSTNTVTFISNGITIDTQSIPSGLTAIAPSVELYGYVLQGWFTADGEEFSPSLIITKNMTFIARWKGILQYTTDPISDGIVTAIEGQPGTVSFRATDSLYYSSVLWDFGDGTTSTDLYSTHYYSQPGSYTATLTVFNNYGSDTTEFIIEVPEMAPGGGGGNDLLLWIAVGLMCIIAGGLVVRRLL